MRAGQDTAPGLCSFCSQWTFSSLMCQGLWKGKTKENKLNSSREESTFKNNDDTRKNVNSTLREIEEVPTPSAPCFMLVVLFIPIHSQALFTNSLFFQRNSNASLMPDTVHYTKNIFFLTNEVLSEHPLCTLRGNLPTQDFCTNPSCPAWDHKNQPGPFHLAPCQMLKECDPLWLPYKLKK